MTRTPPTLYHRRLKAWYRVHRRDLPWRRTRDPYAIAVSEVMLQQTQVSRVIPKYHSWMQRWPTTAALARARLPDVLAAWSGLGYNRRGKMLWDAAREVMKKYHGRWPHTVTELQRLPGIGSYTAAAIAAFAWRQPTVAIDTNIRRVLTRWVVGVQPLPPAEMEKLAARFVDVKHPDLWYHALMDFGATRCMSRPLCDDCPFQSYCRAYPAILTTPRQKSTPRVPFSQTNRFVRGAIVKYVVQQGKRISPTTRDVRRGINVSGTRLRTALQQLIREGILHVRRGRYSLSSGLSDIEKNGRI